jgi:ATP-dependent helicase/nuclease subunit B
LSIKFIYGRSGSGKSYYCLNSIKRKIEKGNLNSNILIVPEQFSFQTEKKYDRKYWTPWSFKMQGV